MKYRIKNSYPNKLICVCIIHSTDICVTQLWWPHCNYDLKKKKKYMEKQTNTTILNFIQQQPS